MVMTKKLLPYVNKFSGEVKILPKSKGSKLSEDWARAKVVTNNEGERVFRFEIATPVKDESGKTRMGIATVDISEVDTAEVEDGDRSTE